VKELAVGGVAEVVVGVAVGLMKSERTDDDCESSQGFRRVAGAAFAGDDALNVALEREGDGENELAVAGGDGERMAEGDGFVVGGERYGAGDGDRRNRSVVGRKDGGARGLDEGGAGESDGGAGGAESEGGSGLGSRVSGLGSWVSGLGCGGEGELFIVPEGPEADAEGGSGGGYWVPGVGC